jgi:hypothetical protein
MINLWKRQVMCFIFIVKLSRCQFWCWRAKLTVKSIKILTKCGMSEPFNYNRLAQAVSKLQVKATISDVQAGLDRKAFTDKLSNS